MDKDKFITLINDKQKYDDTVDQMFELTKLDWIESPFANYTDKLFNEILSIYFPQEIVDDIYTWLYEKLDVSINGKRIPTDTIDELWEYVKDSIKK